jgi:hypothetical protein
MNVNPTTIVTEVFQASTGGRYRIKSAYGIVATGTAFPAKGSIPAASGKSGTILSTGTKVRGTSTLFMTQFTEGDFLYQKEVVRRVTAVLSDTLLEIADAFPTDISVAVIPMKCEFNHYKTIYAKNVHASGAAIIQEGRLSSGNTFLGQGVPISYDADAGTLEFTIHL